MYGPCRVRRESSADVRGGDQKLEALANFTRSDQRLDAMKPGATKHEFRTVNATNDKFMLQSERFQTRVQGRDVSAPLAHTGALLT